MPILAVDKFGQIYETSPDREDGQGIKAYPSSCDQQDNTLGNAYLKSQAKNRDLIMRERMNQKMMEREEARQREVARQRHMGRLRQAQREQAIMNDPMVRNNQLRKALAGGCECEHKVGVMGNVMSHNGKMGYEGMSRDQKTIHHALNPHLFPKNTAFGIDPIERKQHEMRKAAYGILKRKSR